VGRRTMKRRPGKTSMAGKDFCLAVTTLRTGPPNATVASSPSVRCCCSRPDTGDAWLLDPSDHLAARIARDGDPEELYFEETDTRFAIGWKGNYQIDGDAFVFIDRDTARVTTILGYPTRKLAQVA